MNEQQADRLIEVLVAIASELEDIAAVLKDDPNCEQQMRQIQAIEKIARVVDAQWGA